MGATIKELDGGRAVDVEVQAGSLFLTGNGFCYEFDEAIFLNQVSRAVADDLEREAAALYPPRRVTECVGSPPPLPDAPM